MGTFRDGLYDHEGYVEARIDIDDPLIPGRSWIAYWSGDVARHFTGEHRPACSCGWTGTARHTGIDDVFLEDELRDELMAEWVAHTDPFLRVSPLRNLAERLASIEDEVGVEIALALGDGATWTEIAVALGRTEQSVRARWGYLDERLVGEQHTDIAKRERPQDEPAQRPLSDHAWLENELGLRDAAAHELQAEVIDPPVPEP